MTYQDILRAGTTIQAVALVGNSYGLLKKKKKRSSDFVNAGLTGILGTSLIKAQSDLI